MRCWTARLPFGNRRGPGSHLPHGRGGQLGPGTELLGGLVEAYPVVQREPQALHPGLPPEQLAVNVQACDLVACLGIYIGAQASPPSW